GGREPYRGSRAGRVGCSRTPDTGHEGLLRASVLRVGPPVPDVLGNLHALLAHACDERVHDLGRNGRGKRGRRASAASGRAVPVVSGGAGRCRGRRLREGLLGRGRFGVAAVAAARGERQRRDEQQCRQVTSVHSGSSSAVGDMTIANGGPAVGRTSTSRSVLDIRRTKEPGPENVAPVMTG